MMHNSWDKERSRRIQPKNPSFSSSLLDEIYRSIDGKDHHPEREDLKFFRERSSSAKKHSQSGDVNGNGCRTGKTANAVEDAKLASLKRACLIEKWMEKQANDKGSARRNLDYSHPPSAFFLQDDDTLFFSTTSSSSDSSSGGLSSSDTEFFASVKSSKSCFATIKKPKPVKTSVKKQQNDFFMEAKKPSKTEENLIKSKSRALKIYANLKKVKEPISPGGRLTSFINNLFTSGNSKKSNNISSNPDRKSSTQASSTCSSASSFSRSCLSKTSPTSRAAKFNEGIRRTVRFCPVSVIVDEDSRPCGHKQIHDLQDSDKFVRPPLSETKKISVMACQDQKKDHLRTDRLIQDKNFGIKAEQVLEEDQDFDDYEEEEEEDAASDCSSDLFEIDHLSLIGSSRFLEELPVYETTHLDTNRAIASGLIR